MKFVFHMGLEDVITLIVVIIIVALIIIFWVAVGLANLRDKFNDWKKKTFKKGSDKDGTGNGELKGNSNESSNSK